MNTQKDKNTNGTASDMNKTVPWYKRRSFKTGSLATAVTVIFIAVIIIINIIVSVIGESFSLKLDMTSDSIYTMTESTSDSIKSFDKSITITSFLTREELENYFYSFAGNAAVLSALEECERLNPNISIRYIDLNTYPDIASDYNTTMISYGNVICFECDGNQEYVGVSDFYVLGIDDETGYNYDSLGNAVINGDQIERCIIKSLLLVTTTEKPKAAYITGHEEADSSNFVYMIEDSGIDLSYVQLLTDDIPAEADFIVLPAPTTDYSTLEIDKLEVFLERDGSNSIIAMLSVNQGEMPNFDSFLKKWGIEPGEGVIEETDSSSYASGLPELILTSTESDTSSFIDDMPADRPVLSYRTRNSKLLFEQSGDITVTPLISTYGSAVVKYSDGTYGEKNTYPILTKSYKSHDEGDETIVDALYVFSTPEIFNDDIITTYSGSINNENLGNAMINSLTYRTIEVDVPDRNITDRALNISQNIVTIVGFYIFTIAVPLAVLAVGFVTWIKRRRL